MIKKLLKSFTVFLIILGIFFSNIPFGALTFFIDSYQKTSGVVDKIWLVEQSRNSDVVDKFVSLRNISDKLRIHEAHASSFVAVSNYNSAGSASALVNKPTGTVDNDIMFAVVMRNTATAPTTVPAGWALLGSHINGVYQQRLYWKLAAGEGASYTWAWAASAKTAITIAAYRGGFDTANPIDVVSNTEFVTTPNTTVRAASMNVTAPNSSLFWFGTIYSTTVRTWTKPSIPTTGWMEDYDGGANSSDFSRTIDSMVWVGSGATGNMDGTVVTGGTTVKHAFAVALKPPPANTPPTLSISQPDGISDTVTIGSSYNITYSLADTEDIVTAAFYYDTNAAGLDGIAISGACAMANEGAGVTCSWNTTGVSPGTYYIYGITSDGINPQVSAYSTGMITINAPNPDATGFTNISEGLPDGGRSNQQITVTGSNFGTVSAGSRGNCAGGAGTGCIKIGTDTLLDGDINAWSDSSISFTVNSGIATYGGVASLTIYSVGNADATPMTFYIYPNITSISSNSGQIGSTITISGDHLGTTAGTITINTKTATVGTWEETNLLNVTVPGQEGALNINGKIQITRSDAKTSNLYPAGNFVILAPSISASNPATATTGQILTIEFTGQGIDTDLGTAPILKLTKTGQTDITGTSYAKVTDHQKVNADFDLSGAVTGWWNLVIVNMDTQSGTRGDESTFGFYISAPNPTVTGINPDFGLNSGIKNITSITGTGFDSDAVAKLTNSTYGIISTTLAFTRTSATQLSNGSFDLTGKNPSWWKVEVTNIGAGTTGSYGDESTTGFEIRSALPSIPTNLSQSKTELGSPSSEGSGIGGQITIYLRMEMEGGSADDYTPEVEVKPYSTPLDGLTDIYSGTPVYYDPAGGIPSKGSVLFTGTDGESYHWRARVRNSQGTSNWTSFGIVPEPNDKDFYLDNTPPSINLAGGDCTTATTNITDLSAKIGWSTFDGSSGALSPLGTETSYAYPKIQYIETSLFDNWLNPGYFFPLTPPWEDSPHQISLSGLSPNKSYTYRIISEDSVGNIGYSSVSCTFSTESSFPVKTIELFILQESAQNSGTQISKPFSVYIPESPGTNTISVKSSFIEISGISSAGNQEIDAQLQQNSNAYIPPGAAYSIDSTGTTTPFVILFDALNPSGGSQDMKNITNGGQTYDYTLYLNGNGIPVSVFSAKLIITYTYKP